MRRKRNRQAQTMSRRDKYDCIASLADDDDIRETAVLARRVYVQTWMRISDLGSLVESAGLGRDRQTTTPIETLAAGR